MTVTWVKQIPKSICNRNQSHKAIKRRPICLTGYYYDYIIDEIKRTDTF